jgi:hypothetical protein
MLKQLIYMANRENLLKRGSKNMALYQELRGFETKFFWGEVWKFG